MYTDIRDYKEGNIYVNSKFNILIDYKSGINYITIYKKVNNEYKKMAKLIVAKQKTGYGYKRFFKCPKCGQRRQYLYLNDDSLFICRKCIGNNVYKIRTSLYDENIENIIKYKMVQQLKLLSNPIPKVSMIDLIGNIPERPKYMRENKYSLICMRIYFLDWIYWQFVGNKQNYTVKEINEMLEENNTRFVYETMIFPQYYRTAYLALKKLNFTI